MELNINTLETQKIVKNWLNISENDKVETVFEPRIFELNETDIGYDENYESNNDSDFDEFESKIRENKNNDYESDIIIEQKKSKNLTSCVLIDKVDGKIQKCKNTESFRTLWQLVGVWQIDNEKILEVGDSLEKLEVCSYHFNHDQNKLHDSKIKRTSSTADSILHRRRCLFCEKLFYFLAEEMVA
ncbi:hypothetical protein RhiirA4_484427 [Rhizophagus irregularis]|uniref:Uncharacterized protein n=1 Tax=Rhizophagus irregularis TaxID=588596 RepID=A0A2I1HNX8_9GLOM|nr:hypothetical protein RhiirA4_484427 [Rhizophagus irregularis]